MKTTLVAGTLAAIAALVLAPSPATAEEGHTASSVNVRPDKQATATPTPAPVQATPPVGKVDAELIKKPQRLGTITKSCSGASVLLSYVDSGSDSQGTEWRKYKLSISLTGDDLHTPGALSLEIVEPGGDGAVITGFQKLAGITALGNGVSSYDDIIQFCGQSFGILHPNGQQPGNWTAMAILKFERWGVTGPCKVKLRFGYQVHSPSNWANGNCNDFSQAFFLP